MSFFDKDKINSIQKYSYVFLWSQLFPTLIYIINGYKNIGNIEVVKNLKAGIRICIIMYLFFILLSFISPKKIYKFVMTSLIIINVTANIFDLFAYINFGTQINSDIFYTMLETNINESKEFLLNYFNMKFLIIIAYLIYILFIAKIKYKLISFIVGILSVIIIVFSFNLEGNDYTRKYVLATLKSSYVKYQNDAKEYKETLKELKNFNLKDQLTDLNKEESIYVMVIGESGSKYHSSLYGYFRETNPNLKKLKEKNELFIFNNVISSHGTTRESLQKALTLKDSKNNYKFYESPSILDLFKEAGFKTYWISNQESYGSIGNVVAALASKADYIEYTEISALDSRKFKKYDEALLPIFDKILKEKKDRKFIVIHLMGNHIQYKERVPEKFKKFTDMNNNFNEWQKNKIKTVNGYDNSILYVDYIVSEVISKIKKENKKSYVLYFSDHGEEIYDSKNFMGHGQNGINKYIAEVPFILWISDKYKKDINKVTQISKSLDNKYITEDLPYTLIDLSYIQWKNFIPEKSVVNINFKEKERYHNNIKYDKQ